MRRLRTYGVYIWNSDPASYYLVLGFPGLDVTGIIFNKSGTMNCLFTIDQSRFTNVKEVGYIYDDKNNFKISLSIPKEKRC